MIKFKYKNNSNLRLLPVRPAAKAIASLTLVVFLAAISFLVISVAGPKKDAAELSNCPSLIRRLACLIWPQSYKQNVNSTLINLPGGQFLPSLSSPLNILVMGVDSNGRNTQRFVGTRSDSMILVSIDPQKNKVGAVSIPRDSRLSIANGHGEDKINAAHAIGGPQLAVATVKEAFRVPVDRYLVVDAQGLKQILALLGPIDVLVEKKMNYTDQTGKLYINLEPGLKTLDAGQAEGYIRFRHDAKGDIGRIDRQQWFMRAMARQCASPQMVMKLPEILKISNDCILTDLSMEELVKLAGFACHLNPDKVTMATLPGQPAIIHGISYWLPEWTATTALLNKLVNTEPRPGQESGLAFYSRTLVGLDSAMAFSQPSTSYSAVSRPVSSALNDRTLTASIRYPAGSEKEADGLEFLLRQSGLISKGKFKADLCECQHEQIIENSVRALRADLDGLHNQMPCLNNWPTVININPQTNGDITFVITPGSKFANLASSNSTRQL